MLEWYDNLSAARGINSVADVQRITGMFAPGYERLLKTILPSQKDAAIYDAGCGPGLTLNILKLLGYTNLEGTDLSGDAINLALGLGLNVSQANSIEDLASRENRTYKCILAIDFIEHLDKPDVLKFLDVARSKLNEGGLLVMRCPNGDSPLVGRHLFNDLTHVWTYTSTALSVILRMSGFTKTAILDETLPFLQPGRFFRGLTIKSSTWLLRLIIKGATQENIKIFAPSFWIIAGADAISHCQD